MDSWDLSPSEVFRSNPDGDQEAMRAVMQRVYKAGGSPSGLPHWLGYTGRGRADGVLIKGLYRHRAAQKTGPGGLHVYLIEYTRTSEAYWKQSEAAKHKQHAEMVKAITEAGYKCTLLVLQVGVRGGVPQLFLDNMAKLGISKKAARRLAHKLGRQSAIATVTAWHTRRRLGKPGAGQAESTHGMTTRSRAVLPDTTSGCVYDAHGAYVRTAALLRKLEKKRAGTEP